jgi:hypothetical protein
MNNDWSDDENDNNENEEELVQPNRDFPISDEEEEDDYDMYELSKLTINKQISYDFKESKNEKIEEIKSNENKRNSNKKVILNIKNIKNNNVNEKRKFNPRLPPPQKYKNNNKFNFKFNSNDFPTL